MKNNYLKLLFIIIVTIFLTFLISNIYKNYSTNKINNGYIFKHVSSVKYNELQDALIEMNEDTYLYISYTGNKDVYDFEVKFKKLLRDKELLNNVIYLNMDEKINSKENYLELLNEKLNLTDIKVTSLPSIIYYKDGEVIEIINSDNLVIDTGKFMQLLDKYKNLND